MRRALIAAGLMLVILILMAFDSNASEPKACANASDATMRLVYIGTLDTFLR